MRANLQIKSYRLSVYFKFIYQLGLCVMSLNLTPYFKKTMRYKNFQQYLLPFSRVLLLASSLINYLTDISNRFASVGLFGTFSVRDKFVLTEDLLPFFSPIFIAGAGAQFGNFSNWTAFVNASDHKLEKDTWESHYARHSRSEQELTSVGALIVHKYLYKSLKRIPRIVLNSQVIAKDFFFPLSSLATRLQTFYLVFILFKIHVFFRNKITANRLFWTSTFFKSYYRRRSANVTTLPFSYVFRIYGRKYTQMQLWEYQSISKVFRYSSKKIAQMKKELYKDV